MKCAAAIGFLVAFLALPTLAQVEIRGLSIAPPARPGNGGIKLKSLLSTRVPGEISAFWGDKGEVFARIDKQLYRLTLRGGELRREPVPSTGFNEVILLTAFDLDGNGSREFFDFRTSGTINRLVALREQDGKPREVASFEGYGKHKLIEFADVVRSSNRQIIAGSDINNCLHVIGFTNDIFNHVGSLSCGAAPIGTVRLSDMDGDGRKDLIVARQPDRIEIFLR